MAPSRDPETRTVALSRGPMRLAYLALGWASVALAAIGVVLPGLPTVPFLVIAAWAFARSSERLESWLSGHPRFGPMLGAWRAHGVIPLRAKLAASAMMSASLLWLLFGRDTGWPVLLTAALGMAAGAGYIWTKPSRPPGG